MKILCSFKTSGCTKSGLQNTGASNKSVCGHNYGKTICKRPNSEYGMFHRSQEQKIGKQDGLFYETKTYRSDFNRFTRTRTRRKYSAGFIGFSTHDTIIVDGVLIRQKHTDLAKNDEQEVITPKKSIIQHKNGKRTIVIHKKG